MTAFGPTADFFRETGSFSLSAFRLWIQAHFTDSTGRRAGDVAAWLPDELCSTFALDEVSRATEKRAFATTVAQEFVDQLEGLRSRYAGVIEQSKSGSDLSELSDLGADGAEAAEDADETPRLLLNVLFNEGMLPSYAFPTDLCSFYVFEMDGDRARIKERPQQGKDTALSEYAPGRLLVIDKQTYRVGGIYVEGTNSATPGQVLFEKPLSSYVFCPICTYVREGRQQNENELCPICQTTLTQAELLDPPGFSPERGQPLDERDRDQEISYAVAAQFPTPIELDRFEWRTGPGKNLRHAFEQNRRLVTVNKGPEDAGFRVCEACGAAWPASDAPPTGSHQRPFLVSSWILRDQGLTRQCKGTLHNPIYLGHYFSTDLILLRIAIQPPLAYHPRDAWLHDALRTAAEALALSATRRLDIDPGELSANYRIAATASDDNPDALGLADVYLFDTASGGAGYAAEVGEHLPEILQQTLELLHSCPAGCERSCTKCLRHYGNRFWHQRLDRHLAAQLISYALNANAPQVASIDEQAKQLAPLQRYLELEGWKSQLGTAIGGTAVPLLVSLPGSGPNQVARHTAVGTYPALSDRNDKHFRHPLHALDRQDDVSVVLLNDYILTRDLPTAYDQFLHDARISVARLPR